MESKYYYNKDHSDNIMLLDVDPNCIIMKERMIEKVLIDRYADYDNTKEWIPMTPFTSKYWHKRITSLRLAKNWCIGCRRADTILEATTQNSSRAAKLPISRRYRVYRRYRVKWLDRKFSTDTIYSDIKSNHYFKTIQLKHSPLNLDSQLYT